MRLLPLLPLLAGCPAANSGKASTETYDTGGALGCPAVSSIEPASGTLDVYYRSNIEVLFDDDGSASAIQVLDPTGVAIPATVTWTEDHLRATVAAEMEPSTAYTVSVELIAVNGEPCDEIVQSTLTTSTLGAPLEIDVSQLVGRVYFFTLEGADIVEPAALEAFDTQLTEPLLFAVMEASEESIRFEGGVGDADTRLQVDGKPTWPFPPADFTDRPYFSIGTDLLSVDYTFGEADVTIPIEDFTLTGTFAADGSQVEEAYVTGMVDTRYLGPLLPADDSETEACDTLAAIGVYCEACVDGAELCLPMIAENITALWVEGTTLVPVE